MATRTFLASGKPGFQGFFEIKNPDTLDGLLFLGCPVNQDTLGWAVSKAEIWA